MDFRKDLSTPFQAPYQPSVAHYTDNYILLISGSKAFSYAGQRIGVSCISDKLYHRSTTERPNVASQRKGSEIRIFPRDGNTLFDCILNMSALILFMR